MPATGIDGGSLFPYPIISVTRSDGTRASQKQTRGLTPSPGAGGLSIAPHEFGKYYSEAWLPYARDESSPVEYIFRDLIIFWNANVDSRLW